MAIPPPLEGGYQLWHYYPSLPGAIIMTILFSLLTLSHLALIIKTGKKFLIPVIIGGLFEVVGYAFRAHAHSHTSSKLAYSIQSVLILLAPILFAASTYMYLGRIITSFTSTSTSTANNLTQHPTATPFKLSPIPVRFLTKIFVTGDVVCFFIQAGGGGLLASGGTAKSAAVGENVILGGLILQIAVFLVFVGVSGVVHSRGKKAGLRGKEWEGKLAGLYVVSGLITIRNVVRVIEYGVGSEGYLLTHEWTIFVFDAVLMVGVMGLCLLWYGVHVVGRKQGERLEGMGSLTSLDKGGAAVV